jgi:hypothetical protein
MSPQAGTVFSSANFFVCADAQGGRGRITNCYGEYSGDVGVETDAMTDMLVENVTIQDANAQAFYQTNFNSPTNPTSQKLIYRGCVARRESVSVSGQSHGWLAQNSNSIALGRIVLENCSYFKNNATLDLDGECMRTSGSIDSVEVDKFLCTVEGVNKTDASNVTANLFAFGATTGPSGSCPISLRRLRFKLTGARTGSGVLAINGVILGQSGVSNIVLDVDGVTWSSTITGLSATSIHIFDLGSGGGTTLRGSIRKLRVVNVTGDTAPKGIVVRTTTSLSISDALWVEDCDFKGFPSGGLPIDYTDATNRPKVYLYGVKGYTTMTWPVPSVAMSATNFAAGTFTTATGNQYIGGNPAEIHFATGTGAGVTLIEASKDGTTYEQMYAQASGAMAQNVLVPVDNGDYVRVTFSTTQPTTRVRFRK